MLSIPSRFFRGLLLWFAAALLLAGCQPANEEAAAPPEEEASYRARIEEGRRERDEHYHTTTFNAFGLIKRHYFDDEERLTIGSGAGANLRIDDPEVAALHAVVEGLGPAPQLKAIGRVVEIEDPSQEISELTLESRAGFQIGRYHLRFNVSRTGRRNVEVYDPEHPNVKGFESLDYYPVGPNYRLTGTIVPFDDPKSIIIIDSQGAERPHYLFGELRFQIGGAEHSLELYTTTLDPAEIAERRHMLLFKDETSGEETYPAARYLYVEGKTRGEVEVDFNLAFNPSCNYSYEYQCPLPRRANRLKVAIPAGEKWYRKLKVEIQKIGP